jgi:hypothetical protein
MAKKKKEIKIKNVSGNVTISKGQQGGITASNVSTPEPDKKRPKTWSLEIILTGIGTLIAVLTYFGFQKDFFKKEPQPVQQSAVDSSKVIPFNIDSIKKATPILDTVIKNKPTTMSDKKKKPEQPIKVENVKGDVVISQNQTGGITAHTVNVGVGYRHLNAETHSQFISALSVEPKEKIVLKALMFDVETQNLCAEIHEVFKKTGWTIRGPIWEGNPNGPRDKVYFVAPDAKAQNTNSVLIYNWLINNKLNMQPELRGDSVDEFIIYVGSNQP